jgi:hypothetical protein
MRVLLLLKVSSRSVVVSARNRLYGLCYKKKKKQMVTKESLSNDIGCVEEGVIWLHSFLASRLVENCLRTGGRKLLALWKGIQ